MTDEREFAEASALRDRAFLIQKFILVIPFVY